MSTKNFHPILFYIRLAGSNEFSISFSNLNFKFCYRFYINNKIAFLQIGLVYYKYIRKFNTRRDSTKTIVWDVQIIRLQLQKIIWGVQ